MSTTVPGTRLQVPAGSGNTDTLVDIDNKDSATVNGFVGHKERKSLYYPSYSNASPLKLVFGNFTGHCQKC